MFIGIGLIKIRIYIIINTENEVSLMFQIGNIKLKNNIVLAPMAGISNSAYRTIIKDMVCGLIYAEMVSDKAIYY